MNAKAEHKDDIFEDRKRVKNAIKTKEQSLENSVILQHKVSINFLGMTWSKLQIFVKLTCLRVTLEDFLLIQLKK